MPGKDDSFPGSRAYSSFRFLNRGQFGRWDSDNQTSRSSLTGSLAPLKPWCLSHEGKHLDLLLQSVITFWDYEHVCWVAAPGLEPPTGAPSSGLGSE